MNIYDLAVKITLNSGDFTKGVSAATEGMTTLVSGISTGTKRIDQLGSVAMKAYTSLATDVAKGVGTLVKLSTDSYGSYEQLVGGVETLFGAGGQSLEEYAESQGKTVAAIADKYDSLMRAQKTVLDNAAGAYKTAGLSANEYIETVTSFSASLLQSLGGDTEAAAKSADLAITDMADNANKMGTDMAMIQSAYQGFAKQNYTMLDNLKLGYGGTKTEMERLIKYAAELDDSIDASSLSFDNIVNAIHAVQTQMGITGTTADEAASTIQGSAASMKGAWSNFLTGLADDTQDIGKLTDQLIDSVGIYADNLLLRIEMTFDSIVGLIDDRTDEIGELVGNALLTVANKAPTVISAATNVISGVARELVKRKGEIKDAGLTLFNSFLESFEDIADEAMPLVEEFVPAIVEGFISYKGTLFNVGVDIIMAIVNGVSKNGNAKMLADKAASAVTGAVNKITENLDEFLDAGMTIIVAIGDGIINNVDLLIDGAFGIVDSLLEFISNEENAKTIVGMAVTIITKLATGIGNNLDELIPAATGVVLALCLELTSEENMGKIMEAAELLLQGLVLGLVNSIPDIAEAAPDIISMFVNASFSGFSGLLFMFNEFGNESGKSFLAGLLEGIWDASFLKQLIESVQNIFKFIKGEISVNELLESKNIIVTPSKAIVENLFPEQYAAFNESFENGVNGATASTTSDGRKVTGAAAGSSIGGFTMGDLVIHVDGSKFDDEQALAEYIAQAMQDLMDRREEAFL